MKKHIFFLSVLFFTPRLRAGELNLAGLFEGFADTKISEQRRVEEKLEQELKSFRSILSARVMIPEGEVSKVESVWGMNEPRVLPVAVTLSLRKTKRLSQNEFHSITSLVTAALSEKDRVVQAIVRDEGGFEWSEEGEESKAYFKSAALESEIWERINRQWSRNLLWQQVHVSDQDASCVISATYNRAEYVPDLKTRREMMELLQDICPTSRISLLPTKHSSSTAASKLWMQWLENVSYVVLGFALWGLSFALFKRKDRFKGSPQKEAEDAIVLTKIVERSPDQAAKWMLRAMLSENNDKTQKETLPQIFDQPE